MKPEDRKNFALRYRGGVVLIHEVLWFMSVSPWMADGFFSGEVAHIHMRTDAKNLITAARTIHLTIHMISMLRKEARSGNIQDLAHIPAPNCSTDCLTKASAHADTLITVVQTRKLLDVDIHLNFRTLWNTKLSYPHGAEHFGTQE